MERAINLFYGAMDAGSRMLYTDGMNGDMIHVRDQVVWTARVGRFTRRAYGTVEEIVDDGMFYMVRHGRTGIVRRVPRGQITKEFPPWTT